MAESSSSALASAISQFNRQDFYACHDTLEALWIDAATDDKKFFQGLLQVAVAFYHLGNGNWRGAVVLLGEGRFRLIDYEPTHADVHVQQLRQDTAELFADLQAMQPNQVGEIVAEFTKNQRDYPQIKYTG